MYKCCQMRCWWNWHKVDRHSTLTPLISWFITSRWSSSKSGIRSFSSTPFCAKHFINKYVCKCWNTLVKERWDISLKNINYNNNSNNNNNNNNITATTYSNIVVNNFTSFFVVLHKRINLICDKISMSV